MIGQFIPGQSYLHRLHPQSKLLFVLFYTCVLFGVSELIAYLWLALIPLGGYVLSRIPFPLIWQSVRPILWLSLFLFVLHLFLTKGGNVIWSSPFLSIYSHGVEQGLRVVIRLILLVLTAALLTFTTAPFVLTDAFAGLLKPLEQLRVPVNSLALMMSIALRFIPVIFEEMERIQKAQLARGASIHKGSVRHRLQSLQAIFIPILLAVFRRADELALAMEARCYSGEHQRTQWKKQRFTHLDIGLVVVALVVFIGVYSISRGNGL